MRLIDADAFQFEPDPVDNIMNGVLFLGRGTGKTLLQVQCCLKAMIENAPAIDAAEVVRCKDCRYWHEDILACEYLPRSENGTRPAWYGDDFCSYGERRTE